jgi:hypothetical protein
MNTARLSTTGTKFVAAAPGHAPVEARFELDEGEHETVTIAALVALPKPTPRPTPRPAKKPPPRPRATPTPTPDAEGSRFVFDVGFFGGYLLLQGAEHPSVEGSVPLIDDMGQAGYCDQTRCRYELGDRGGAIFGANAFAGYAATDWLHVGGRMLAGPRAGGGLVFAAVPVVSFRVAGPLWLGAGLVLGTASVSSRGSVTTTRPGDRLPNGSSYDMEATTEVGPGPLLELRLGLLDLPSGRLEASLTPFAVFSNGGAVAIPLTLAYRFQ